MGCRCEETSQAVDADSGVLMHMVGEQKMSSAMLQLSVLQAAMDLGEHMAGQGSPWRQCR